MNDRSMFVSGAGWIQPPGDTRNLIIEEVAAQLRKSVSGVRKDIRNGKIPADAYFRVGGTGRLLFKRDRLDQLERDWT